jgi:hypothetical protein
MCGRTWHCYYAFTLCTCFGRYIISAEQLKTLKLHLAPVSLWQSFVYCCSLASSTGDLSNEAAQLERAIHSNDTLKVKRFLDLHHDKFQVSSQQTDWLADWLAGWLTGWLTDWLTDWLTGWLADWLTGWLTDWLTAWLTCWLAAWLTCWLAGWLTDQPHNYQTEQLTYLKSSASFLTFQNPTSWKV